MKALIYSLIVIALTIPVWLHWGGFNNDLGTLILALVDVFIINIIVDNHKKSPVKE